MWLALHAHRQVHPQQYPLVIKQAQEAHHVLKGWIQGTVTEIAQVKESPKQVRAARKAKGKTASVRAVAAATHKPKASKVAPTTPKRPRSKYATTNSLYCLQLVSFRVRSISQGWTASHVQGGECRSHAKIFSSDCVTFKYAYSSWTL